MPTKADTLQPDAIPYFAWDRNLTTRQIRQKLHTAAQPERDCLCAWLLREAATEDVWVFVRPAEVAECLPRIGPMLGRKRAFWTYVIGKWRELGKL